jgi:phosphate transport system permease protein
MHSPALLRSRPSSIRRAKDALFRTACFAGVVVSCLFLFALLYSVLRDGLGGLKPEFFQNFSSRFPERAGIRAALVGSVWIILLTVVVAVPVGIATAIFLEDFADRRKAWVRAVQLNIANLAGVPSIVYGLLGLAVFVRWMLLGRSILAGALTMALVVLPMIIVVAQESIRAVPSSLREGAIALGATKWQAIRSQVLPSALPGIVTGVILAVSRAIGETAPLIVVGAVTFIAAVPSGLESKFTVLPIQIFDWTVHPRREYHQLAASAIVVLLAMLLTMNAVAVGIRMRSRGRRA